jgi:VIT1/CCC1 family predicted Fe2+/Mn2+ transporter
MPQTPHVEKHFTAGNVVRDIVIGMSDGLTVPFALAAGLSGAVASSGIVVTAGLAEVAAGSIAMGLGGFLASRSDTEHYINERLREEEEIVEKTQAEEDETADVFRTYGLSDVEIAPIITALKQKPQAWVDFMMRFELGLEKPEPTRARNSALTIAISYIVGGMVPLFPYMLTASARRALLISIGVTLVALFVFGYVKGRFTGKTPIRSAIQTTVVGGLAAAAAFMIAKLIA